MREPRTILVDGDFADVMVDVYTPRSAFQPESWRDSGWTRSRNDEPMEFSGRGQWEMQREWVRRMGFIPHGLAGHEREEVDS